MRRSKMLIGIWTVIVLCLILFPILTSNAYVIGVMCFIALYGSLALGKGLLLEQAGIFSLAHPTWFGLGAYVTGIAAARGVPPVLAIVMAAASVALIAFILGAPLLRLKGYYLACATFSLLLVVEILLGNMGSLTGGYDGLIGIPALSLWGIVFEGDLTFYFLSWGLCLATYWFVNNLMKSQMGMVIKSFHDTEAASRSMGVNVSICKLKLFVITALMASLVGSVFCFWIRFVMPSLFGFPLLVELITIIIIGGGKTIYGPLLGSFVVMWMRELIHAYLGKILPVMTAEVDALFFGMIVVVILIFMPGGLSGWAEQCSKAVRKIGAGYKTA